MAENHARQIQVLSRVEFPVVTFTLPAVQRGTLPQPLPMMEFP